MSRQRVEVVKCDRCKRDELQPVPELPKTSPDLEVKFRGESLIYEDLCADCEKTIANLVQDMREWNRKINSILKPVDELQAPPLEVAPNYTPPRPHSPGANKK